MTHAPASQPDHHRPLSTPALHRKTSLPEIRIYFRLHLTYFSFCFFGVFFCCKYFVANFEPLFLADQLKFQQSLRAPHPARSLRLWHLQNAQHWFGQIYMQLSSFLCCFYEPNQSECKQLYNSKRRLVKEGQGAGDRGQAE